MKISRLTYLTLFGIFSMPTLFGQISFSDQTMLLDNPDGYRSGNVIGISDMNADGLDDIVRLDEGKYLSIEYQVLGGGSFVNYLYGDTKVDPWAIVVGDVNNDGYGDIMVGGFYKGAKVLTAVDNGTSYLSSFLPGPKNFFAQGSNMADINNDGHLDIFVCHDDGESRIWGNDSTGNFFPANEWIDMSTIPTSDKSGNYGSVWTDFDNDGDLDLFIAKCREGIDDPTDPRRINALFVNDGNSNYHEAAGEHGLKIGHQSWTADFQDIDNDGDLDCFVTNHDHDPQLLENDGAGHFTDISVDAGIVIGYDTIYIQGIMKDFDNDGFMDIVTSQPTVFFRNNGDKTFSEMTPFDESFGSLAVGDLNHDGFIDLYTAYQKGFSEPGFLSDKLWLNDGNDNHFLAVSLKGVQSNKMGIGARIEIFGDWGIQVREVRAGESYGIMNSLTKTFGLAGETVVDYVMVKWPSGVVDVLGDVTANQFITIVEGTTCSLPTFQIDDDGIAVICEGTSVTLEAPDGYSYLWNDGSTSRSVLVDSPANYSVVIVDSQGCAALSETVQVILEPDQSPTIEVVGDTIFCEHGNTKLVATAFLGENYTWSNGEKTFEITVTETGDYQVVVEGYCDDFASEEIHLEVLAGADEPLVDDVNVVAPAKAILEASGGFPHWYETLDTLDPIATGNFFETPTLNDTATYYVADVIRYGGEEVTVGMPEHQGDLYSTSIYNGRTRFEVYEKIVLKQVTVTTDIQAVRIIELWDEEDVVVNSLEIDLPEGETVVDLNFTIEPGSYRLTTNSDQNFSELGYESPRLTRSDEGVNYPYEIPDVMSITDSNFGSGFYYYFFDWKVELPSRLCFSERVPVTVYVGPNTVQDILPFGKLSVMPNPSTGTFSLEIQAYETGEAQISIIDATGRQIFLDQIEVKQNTPIIRTLDLGQTGSGLYFLKITVGERASWAKLVVE